MSMSKPQEFWNKVIEVKYSVEFMVWPWWRLQRDGLPVGILIRCLSKLLFTNLTFLAFYQNYIHTYYSPYNQCAHCSFSSSCLVKLLSSVDIHKMLLLIKKHQKNTIVCKCYAKAKVFESMHTVILEYFNIKE